MTGVGVVTGTVLIAVDVFRDGVGLGRVTVFEIVVGPGPGLTVAVGGGVGLGVVTAGVAMVTGLNGVDIAGDGVIPDAVAASVIVDPGSGPGGED